MKEMTYLDKRFQSTESLNQLSKQSKSCDQDKSQKANNLRNKEQFMCSGINIKCVIKDLESLIKLINMFNVSFLCNIIRKLNLY